MNSLFGMLIGAIIVFFIGIVRSSREYHELEQRPTIKDSSKVSTITFESTSEERSKNKGAKFIYASRAPINSFRQTSVITLCFVTIMVGLAVLMGGFNDLGFLIAVGAGTLLVFSPILGVSAYYASIAKDAIASKRSYFEFHDDGIICHSKLCGPVQEILWTEIVKFSPIFPRLGTPCSIQIEHRVRGETEIVQSHYMVNLLDIELGKFVSLLEYYTGQKTRQPDSNLYHA